MLCFLEGDHMYVVSSAYAVCDPASLSRYTLFITSPPPAPLVLQFLGTSFCSQPRAPVPSSSWHLRGSAAAYPGLTVYPVQPGNWPHAPDYHRTPISKHTLLSAVTIREYLSFLIFFNRRKKFWDSRGEKEKHLGYMLVIFLLLLDLVTLSFFTRPSCLSWRAVCVCTPWITHSLAACGAPTPRRRPCIPHSPSPPWLCTDARTTSPTLTWPPRPPLPPPPHRRPASSPATRWTTASFPGSTTTTTLTAATCPPSSITTRLSTTHLGISHRCRHLAVTHATTFATRTPTHPMTTGPHPQTWATLVGQVCAPAPPVWAAAAPLQGPPVCLLILADRLCHLLRPRRGTARGKVTVQVRGAEIRVYYFSSLSQGRKSGTSLTAEIWFLTYFFFKYFE